MDKNIREVEKERGETKEHREEERGGKGSTVT